MKISPAGNHAVDAINEAKHMPTPTLRTRAKCHLHFPQQPLVPGVLGRVHTGPQLLRSRNIALRHWGPARLLQPGRYCIRVPRTRGWHSFRNACEGKTVGFAFRVMELPAMAAGDKEPTRRGDGGRQGLQTWHVKGVKEKQARGSGKLAGWTGL